MDTGTAPATTSVPKLFARLAAYFSHLANGRNILLLLSLYMVVSVAIMPLTRVRLEALSEGVGPLDLKLAYTPTEAYATLAAYGEAGRAFYALVEVTLDVINAAVYALFLGLTITYCYVRVAAAGHWSHRLGMLAFFTLLADLAENAGIVVLLWSYPAQLTWLARLGSLFTTTKWLLAVVTVTALVIGLVALGIKRPRPSGTAGVAP